MSESADYVGTTKEKLYQITAGEQMEHIYKYYERNIGRINDVGDLHESSASGIPFLQVYTIRVYKEDQKIYATFKLDGQGHIM